LHEVRRDIYPRSHAFAEGISKRLLRVGSKAAQYRTFADGQSNRSKRPIADIRRRKRDFRFGQMSRPSVETGRLGLAFGGIDG
jgi:hypothetical protein